MNENSSLIQEMKYNKITLSFPPKNEVPFLKQYFTDSLLQFRLSFLLVIFLYAVFGFLDPIITEKYASTFQAIRFYFVVPLFTAVLICSYFEFFEKVWQYLLFISFLVGGAGICIMTILLPENYTYYAGLMLIFSAGYFFIKLRFFPAMIAGWITLMVYDIGAIFFSEATNTTIISNNFFYVSANLIGMFAAYNIEFYARRDFYLNQQLDEQYAEVDHLNVNLEKIVDERTSELILAKDKAEQSDALKSAFLANMSHEVRTPLNAINGFAELLPGADDDDERQEYVNIIATNVKDLLALIDDIMDISKIEAGLLELVENEFSLNELMREITKSFQVNENVKAKKLEIITKTGLSDSQSFIVADKKRLKQVLVILTGNACKFTHTGYIEIGYRLFMNEIYFYVKDTGTGISPDKQKNIFDRFMQSTLSHTPEQQGSGMGLAISKSLVKLFNGEIWVESNNDDNEGVKGSVFYFTLPLKKGNNSTLTFDKHNNPTMEYNWKDKLILVAEDVSNNFLLVKKSLKKTEAEIIWAKNGQEAVDEFKKNPKIDLVLMDIRMPIMNGLEATRQIKAINPSTPVIAQTAYAMDGDRERSLSAGCDDYISKPINLKEFIELIARFLEK